MFAYRILLRSASPHQNVIEKCIKMSNSIDELELIMCYNVLKD
jgi:hypothetical protein